MAKNTLFVCLKLQISVFIKFIIATVRFLASESSLTVDDPIDGTLLVHVVERLVEAPVCLRGVCPARLPRLRLPHQALDWVLLKQVAQIVAKLVL